MATIDLAEQIKTTNMFDLAYRTNHGMQLTDDERDVQAALDARFKEIGASGHDRDHEIAAFVQKVVNEELYNTPDELLDMMFDQGTIGVNDDFELITTPKNTLIAYEAATGGNVPRSFLDVTVMTPTWHNRQIETDISYADLERNGWKSVSQITEYATAALKNRMFCDIFETIDAAIQSGADNYLNETGKMPTQATMDWLALYIQDRADNGGSIIGLSKYIQAASKLTGFVSDDMINQVNRTGRLGVYDGVSLVPISSAKKLGDGSKMIPDLRLFGVAGKIGTLNMKGDVKIYQDADNNREAYHLMFKNFTYGYAFNDSALENIAKVVLAA